MTDGSQIWGPTAAIGDAGGNSYDYYNFAAPIANANPIYNGKLYYTGYGGIMRCIDVKTGDLLWTYGNGGEGNSTYAGFDTTWGHYPTWIGVIADGKIYTLTAEHSPNTPLYKDAQTRCINATNGQEIWTLSSYVAVNKFIAGGMYEADGYLVFLNDYDHQIYSVGKGPSAMTVTAPDLSAQIGQSITLKGTVLDIASGTNQNEQAARFPNGVAAVSDASMSAWMEYVYMQKPRPTDATGVPVTLSVVDANGNYRDIGATTTNADGFFSFNGTRHRRNIHRLCFLCRLRILLHHTQ
jgi:outer membrane protein assembly factor BamB